MMIGEHLIIAALSALVGLQILMGRLCGWSGLLRTTVVLDFLVSAGPLMLLGYLYIHSDAVPPPRVLVELGRGLLFFMPLTIQVPLFILLVSFLLLALTVKTTKS